MKDNNGKKKDDVAAPPLSLEEARSLFQGYEKIAVFRSDFITISSPDESALTELMTKINVIGHDIAYVGKGNNCYVLYITSLELVEALKEHHLPKNCFHKTTSIQQQPSPHGKRKDEVATPPLSLEEARSLFKGYGEVTLFRPGSIKISSLDESALTELMAKINVMGHDIANLIKGKNFCVLYIASLQLVEALKEHSLPKDYLHKTTSIQQQPSPQPAATLATSSKESGAVDVSGKVRHKGDLTVRHVLPGADLKVNQGRLIIKGNVEQGGVIRQEGKTNHYQSPVGRVHVANGRVHVAGGSLTINNQHSSSGVVHTYIEATGGLSVFQQNDLPGIEVEGTVADNVKMKSNASISAKQIGRHCIIKAGGNISAGEISHQSTLKAKGHIHAESFGKRVVSKASGNIEVTKVGDGASLNAKGDIKVRGSIGSRVVLSTGGNIFGGGGNSRVG